MTRERGTDHREPDRSNGFSATRATKRSYKEISPEEELSLIRRFQRGDRVAGGMLVEAHEPLIWMTAMRRRGQGIDDEDLLQETKIGFLKAVKRFDPSEGVKLITYADHWMRHYTQRAVSNTGTAIRVPVHMGAKLRRAIKIGDEAALKESILLRSALAAQHMSSLDQSIGEDGSIIDVIPSGEKTPEELLAEQTAAHRRAEILNACMGILTQREARVLKLLYMGPDKQTMQEVGAIVGLSRERIRQIQVIAFDKIRGCIRRFIDHEDDLELVFGDADEEDDIANSRTSDKSRDSFAVGDTTEGRAGG